MRQAGRPWTLAALCLIGALLAGSAAAADTVESPVVARWDATLEEVEGELAAGIEDSSLVDRWWTAVDRIRAEAMDRAVEIDAKSREIKRQIATLGAKPAPGDPPESIEVQAQRQRLDQNLAALESLSKRAKLVVERSDGLRLRLNAAKRRLFSGTLSAALPRPLLPQTWRQAVDEFGAIDNELRRSGRLLGSSTLAVGVLVALALGAVAAARISRIAVHGLLLRHGQTAGDVAPGYRRRVRAAGIVALAAGLLPACLSIGWLWLLWAALEHYHLRDEATIAPVGISLGIVFYFLFSALVRAIFRPRTPAWGLMPLASDAARTLAQRLLLLVALLAVDLPFARVIELAGSPPALVSVHTFALSLALTLVGLSLLPERLWRWQPQPGGETDAAAVEAQQRRVITWRLARWVPTLVFAIAGAVTLVGQGNLGNYLTRGMLWTVLLLVVLSALRGVTREGLTLLLTGHETRPRTSLGMLNFWLLVGADLLLALLGVVGLLLSWGIPWIGVLSAVNVVSSGFTVGQYRIVPGNILLGVAVFGGLVLLTRFVQRHLEDRVLRDARIDIGVRTAIGAITGYAGTALAFVAAVSIMGIDLAQLALIAGALSVGIGFGLQNIVNNFISGAILLAEQPIKIGDWIVVGNIEGNVRRISIRATEIETFNRASVIVPNADLLQTAVTNWTYKNRRGRVDIPVGVGYRSDPAVVEMLLLDCARQHEQVLRWPEPVVLLQQFGDDSLHFELRVFVADIEQRPTIASDLRKAILGRFRASGIEIPFPQRDVWLRSRGRGAAQGVGAAEQPADDGAA